MATGWKAIPALLTGKANFLANRDSLSWETNLAICWLTLFTRILHIKSPQAAVLVNGSLSNQFTLHRGTRQGCPITPLIFALVIEPLAIAIRKDPIYMGTKIGLREDKIVLYADDIIYGLSTSCSASSYRAH